MMMVYNAIDLHRKREEKVGIKYKRLYSLGKNQTKSGWLLPNFFAGANPKHQMRL